jgi:hypothetical protein
MSDITAPTAGSIANALRIRDYVAREITEASTLEKVKARLAAERLILSGYIDVAAIHKAIVDDDDDDGF